MLRKVVVSDLVKELIHKWIQPYKNTAKILQKYTVDAFYFRLSFSQYS